MADPDPFQLAVHPVHLGLGATVTRLEKFTGDPSWYECYGHQVAQDGAEGRLVSLHTFLESWSSWEAHPHGEELVFCIDGAITVHQEVDGAIQTVTLRAGEAVVNPQGVWHTADVTDTATVLFVTAGLGTQNRDR